jgi:predicted ABC-type ATPase
MVKRAIIIAGPNGVGKTTFAKEYLKKYRLKYISADEMADNLSNGDIREVELEAGRQFFEEIDKAMESGESFIVESTLSGLTFRRIINRLRDLGYSISIIFIFLKFPEVCVARIKERSRKGGHHVPERDVIRRFYRSITNFWNMYKDMVGRWYLISNSTQQFIEVALGEGKDYSISEEVLFNSFFGYVREKNEG